MESMSFKPTDYFQIGNGAITLTEQGQRFAGNVGNAAIARGEMLAGMAVRMLNLIDSDRAAAQDNDKSNFLYGTVMTAAAASAQPPLSPGDREEFMAGARRALGGTES